MAEPRTGGDSRQVSSDALFQMTPGVFGLPRIVRCGSEGRSQREEGAGGRYAARGGQGEGRVREEADGR